jgi:hypothetical protein
LLIDFFTCYSKRSNHLKNLTPLISTLLILSLIGCAPSVRRLNYKDGVESSAGAGPDCNPTIRRNLREDPETEEVLGTMKIGDTGFSTNCSEDEVLRILRTEACRLGADVVVLYNIRQPDFISSCYRATADFIRVSGETLTEETEVEQQAPPESDPYYSDAAVNKRVENKKAAQRVLSVVGFIVGFIIGYTLLSPK